MGHLKDKIRGNAGTTLVELVVCFALIGIFMVSAAACVAPVLRSYYEIQKINQAQTVADNVLQTIRAQLQVAQGGSVDGENSNYIKLRDTNGDTVSFNRSGMDGVTIEYVFPYQNDELELSDSFATQLDGKGLSSWTSSSAIRYHMINTEQGKVDTSDTAAELLSEDAYPAGYLVQRFYQDTSAGTGVNVFDCYWDRVVGSGRTAVVYDLELSYPIGSYFNLDFGANGEGLVFSIPRDAIQSVPDETNVYVITYVNVDLALYRAGELVYTTSTSIQLPNQPRYSDGATTYSDNLT